MPKGTISELTAIVSAMHAGKEVAVLHGNHRPFDFLIEDKDGRWLKVQVKTARQRHGCLMVDVRRSKQVTKQPRERKYKDGDFDLLTAVDGAVVYVLPFSMVKGKTCINLYETWKFAWP